MDAKVLILLLLAAAVSGEVVNVTTSKTLGEYLCPQNRTIPPNTDVIISVPLLHLKKHDKRFCLIENTTNITISASREVMSSEDGYSKVKCENATGFGFFNVSNLTLRSVYFLNCENLIPVTAWKYLNESNQFIAYSYMSSTLVFNHCCDVTLYQVCTGGSVVFGIIGANLCGTVNVSLLNETHFSDTDRVKVLLYYTDSPITQPSSKHKLHVQSDMFDVDLSYSLKYLLEELALEPETIKVAGSDFDFSLFLTQQHYDVDITLDIRNYRTWWTNKILIVFVNSVTKSHVIFQSHSNKLCNKSDEKHKLVMNIGVVFYETPSFQSSSSKIVSPITVKNAAFSHGFDQTLSIVKVTRKLSHKVILENLSWCHIMSPFNHALLHAQSSKLDKGTGKLYMKMVNISMHDNSFSAFGTNSLVNFIYIDNATMSGVNYFARNSGGSVMSVVSSSLTITGNLTVNDGSTAYQGGGIRLDSASTLFFKEPLVATFSNNSAAIEGNAIYAPNNAGTENSGIQILPIKVYSLNNVSEIDIHLTFINNTNNGSIYRSLYAPYFSYLGRQTSPNLLLKEFGIFEYWDQRSSQFATTTLIESIIKHISDLDKYSSLDNGICMQTLEKPFWKCKYTDRFDHKVYATPREKINAYPGEGVLLILNMDDNVYEVRTCRNDNSLNSTFWNATVIATNWKKYLRFEFYYSSRCVTVSFRSTAVFFVSLVEIHTTASCPVGFNLTESGCCDCILPLREHGYQCNITTKMFVNPSGYWTGIYNKTSGVTTVLFSIHCPTGYCNLHRHPEFVLNNSLSDFYCNGNRNGTLCGKCKANFSSVFGSDECQSHCSNLYLLTIPIYALAGLLLVVALFALRLTVATGTINGVIFYANVMGLVMRILLGEHPQVYMRVMHVVVSLINLELGFPICFYSGMTPAAKVGLQFVFPVYVWSLVLILVVLSKYSTKVTRLILNSSVQVLATLFFLSFSKILRNVIDIVSYSSMQSIEYIYFSGNETAFYSDLTNKLVWFYDGSDYRQGIHGLYLFLAAVFLVFFLLPYGIFSLGFTCCCRPFNKMKINLMPFIDAYCGPFKDKWRFWFGLRLWVTALLYALDGGLQGRNTNAVFLTHFFIILSFIIVQAFVKPFKNVLITLLDTFFMLNYWLVVEFYLLSKMLGFDSFPGAYTFLLSSAILIMILIIAGHIYFLKFPNFFNTLSEKINGRRERYRYEAVQQEDPDEDQQLFEAAEERDLIVDTY